MQQHWFHTVWPFVGGGAAIVMVAILLTTDTFRSNTTVSRWRDPVWLAWLAAPLYWVHQLEEYSLPVIGQVPWCVQALEGKVSEASWKSKPSWYLVATDDRMIPPPAQQFMSKRAGSTVVESKGSHSVYVSKPGAVAALIETAAEALQASGVAVD